MKSLLNKRLPGILAVGLVALAVGAAGATSGAVAGASNDASISALTAAQKKAKAKALKKCKKIKKASKRKACIKRVNKKYAKLDQAGPPLGPTTQVDVRDDFFSPASLTINSGDQVNWVWDNTNGNAHNVTLSSGPSTLTDIEEFNLSTANAPSRNYSFKRQLVKPGVYDYYCTLHSTVMTMQVTVK